MIRKVKSIFCSGIISVAVLGMITGKMTIEEVCADTRYAQEILIDETTFPDPLFRQWVVDTYDTDLNSELSVAERLKVESTRNMNAFSERDRVEDWTGIEYFTGLTEFKVQPYSNTQLVTLDLSKNKNLTTITVNGIATLNTLNVSGLSALTSLECANTSISELNVSGLSNLQRLVFPNTSVEELDINGLSKLQLLVCNNTPIKKLNVRGLSNLVAIMCGNTSVTELDLTGLSSLEGLLCANTPIAELNLTGLSNLEQLDCDGTSITELDLTGLNNLKRLRCNNTSINALNVSGLTELTDLYCDGCQLTALELSHNTKLSTNLNISPQRVSAPLYYDGNTYYVDITGFPNFDKKKVEEIVDSGTSYSYDSSKGWIVCQRTFNPGDELYYNYDTGTPVKMQVIVEISRVIDLTVPDTEVTTESSSMEGTESWSSTDIEEVTSATEDISSMSATELSTASVNTSDGTVSVTGTTKDNVQRQDTPKTGDMALLLWISILGVFAAASFLIAGRKKL